MLHHPPSSLLLRCLKTTLSALLLLPISSSLFPSIALAQITPDDTLGNERSQVIPTGPINAEIDAGARRGGNLFHSFREFNVPDQGSVYFRNPDGVERILSRVTGTDVSDILGTLGVLGNADLFLLNPNGIVFGPNAQLDVRGSFLATTANGFTFADGSEFSAVNPQAPALLTVNVPIGLQYGANLPGAIISQGSRLFVDQGRSLILAGGAINLDDSSFIVRLAKGGRIELGAVGGAGTVSLSQTRNQWSLNFPDTGLRSDALITNGSELDVTAENGGDIAIYARNIDISGESLLIAGIDEGHGFVDSQAGSITFNAINRIRIEQSSFVINNLSPNATGNGGNIKILTGFLETIEGAQLQSLTLGQGNAGSIIVNARDYVVFEGSVAASSVEAGAIGNGGNVEVITDTLQVNGGAQLIAGTRGQGNAGNVVINANRVVFEGRSANGQIASGVFSSIEIGALGNGGNVEIITEMLQISGGAQLIAATRGQGNAGNVLIQASNRVVFEGTSADGRFRPSAAVSSVESEALGNGGNVEITTETLRVSGGAALIAATRGQGNAGNVLIQASDRVVFEGTSANGQFASAAASSVETGAVGNGGNVEITTDTLQISGGAQLIAATSGQGNAGNVMIQASDRFVLTGVGSGGFSSGLFTSTDATISSGRGGTVVLTTPIFLVTNGAVISANTVNAQAGGNIRVTTDRIIARDGGQLITTADSTGTAGDIILNANRVIFSGTDPTFQQRLEQFGRNVTANEGNGESGLFANTRSNSMGRGGTITVRSNQVEVADQATISVRAEEAESIAGDLRISANQLEVSEGSITVSHPQGQAGSLTVRSPNISLNAGRLTAETGGRGAEQGAEIRLEGVDRLRLRNQSRISAQATDEANGGNVIINANDGFVIANQFEDSDIIARADRGDGGFISITAQGILGLEERDPLTRFSDINASSQFGAPGNIILNLPDIDPAQGLTALPTEAIDASQQIAAGCRSGSRSAASELGEFTIPGRGGLPPNPSQLLENDDSLTEWLSTPLDSEDTGNPPPEPTNNRPAAAPSVAHIIEAQSWHVTADGKVHLVAEPTASVAAAFHARCYRD